MKLANATKAIHFNISFSSEDNRIINFVEDPLLLSCTLYRLNKMPETTVNKDQTYYVVRAWSIESDASKIAARITQEDRIFAELVKRYYRGKLLAAKLRGDEFTKYRTELLEYLTHGTNSVSVKFVGMLYKLPYFYEYDIKLTEEVFSGEYFQSEGFGVVKESRNLKFISKLDAYKKRKVVYEYWFSDDQDNRVLVEVDKNNPLLKLWDIAINNDIEIKAKFEKKRKDNWVYYNATGWKING
jgi:hypothetical protein